MNITIIGERDTRNTLAMLDGLYSPGDFANVIVINDVSYELCEFETSIVTGEGVADVSVRNTIIVTRSKSRV